MLQNNDNILSGIDKYEGSFEQDEIGVTCIPNSSIRALKDFTLLALFTFLASCPKNWRLNAKHLATHFNCNKDKIYKAIDGLIELKFLTRTIIRDKGKFVRYHYRLHLRQNAHDSPFPEKPDTVKPDTVNPDAYKTNIPPLQNNECIKEREENLKLEVIRKKNPLSIILSDKYLLAQQHLTQSCLNDEKAKKMFEQKFGKLEITFQEMLWECIMFYALKPDSQNVSPHRFQSWIKRERIDMYDKKPDSQAHKLWRDLTEEERNLISEYNHFKKYPDIIGSMAEDRQREAKNLIQELELTQKMRKL